MTQTQPLQRPGSQNAVRGDQRPPAERKLVRPARKDDSRYYIDPRTIPDGMDYQWNTVTVLGNEEIARQSAIHMAQFHWTPVPAKRHPELSGWTPGGNIKDEQAIIIGGLRLDERPLYLSIEAKKEDDQAARAQVGAQIQRLGLAPQGTAPRETADGRSMATAKRDYNLSVPEDADS